MTDDSLSEEKPKTLEGIIEHLNKQVAHVPGFTPPHIDKGALYCPLPESCSQEEKTSIAVQPYFSRRSQPR
ncbi:MAG: hypothetical protein ACO2YY_10175 [Pseudohongiellaceae bacterium]